MSSISQDLSNQRPLTESKLNRSALWLGLATSAIIFVYNILVNVILKNRGEGSHFLVFAILFAMIAFAFYRTKELFSQENAMNHRVIFGLKMAGITALGTVVLNLLFFAINKNMEVSEINQPISDFGRFAVNAMGTILGFLSFGFFSALILAFYHEKQ